MKRSSTSDAGRLAAPRALLISAWRSALMDALNASTAGSITYDDVAAVAPALPPSTWPMAWLAPMRVP